MKNETELIRGHFAPNKGSMIFFLLFAIIDFVVLLSLSQYLPTIIIVIEAIALPLFLYLAYGGYRNKNNELVVTDKRVYLTNINSGTVQIELPLDTITSINKTVNQGFQFSSPSGTIQAYYCINRDDVFEIVSQRISERLTNTSNESIPQVASTETPNESIESELMRYKDLFDKGLISKEEYDTAKKKTLNL